MAVTKTIGLAVISQMALQLARIYAFCRKSVSMNIFCGIRF